MTIDSLPRRLSQPNRHWRAVLVEAKSSNVRRPTETSIAPFIADFLRLRNVFSDSRQAQPITPGSIEKQAAFSETVSKKPWIFHNTKNILHLYLNIFNLWNSTSPQLT
jgi:hypothetical protein